MVRDWQTARIHIYMRFFYFFLFLFFTKIYFRYGNLQKYTPAAPLSGGRDLAARLPGGRGLSAKKRGKKLRTGPWEPAARLGGGRPPHPYIRVLAAPPLICLAKNPEKRKEREGGRGGVRERQSGEALSDFQAGDLTLGN